MDRSSTISSASAPASTVFLIARLERRRRASRRLLPQNKSARLGGAPDRARRLEAKLALGEPDLDPLAILDLAREQLARERILQFLLDHALQGPRAIGGIVALLGEE